MCAKIEWEKNKKGKKELFALIRKLLGIART
jgi:hypothetical protein